MILAAILTVIAALIIGFNGPLARFESRYERLGLYRAMPERLRIPFLRAFYILFSIALLVVAAASAKHGHLG